MAQHFSCRTQEIMIRTSGQTARGSRQTTKRLSEHALDKLAWDSHPLPRLNAPFVDWGARKCDSVADHAANVALDDCRDWGWRDPDAVARARQH
eukprot:2736862-Pyramimonas_sp.AAC.1